MTIEKGYKHSDLKRMYHIEKECFNRKIRPTKKAFPKALKKFKVWVVRGVSGKVLGFIAIKKNYIATIDVHPGYRGLGIAGQLLAKVMKAKKKMKLHVAIDNPAISLYLKHAFTITGYKKDFYYKGKHALVMKYGR